jgi:hypothetical protein
MKKAILIFSLITLTVGVKSQTASVEKSVFGIQTGVLGIWVHNESRWKDQLAIRSEIGLNFGLFGGTLYDKTVYVFGPVLRVEPRWYYNLQKRALKSKRVDGNSANFLSLTTSYQFDRPLITNDQSIVILSYVAMIPTWGIRRNMGKHMNYETGLGLGYRYILSNRLNANQKKAEPALNIHLRIGWRI